MLRYSVLRLLMFFGVLSLLWLLGLRGADQQWMLLVLSALISMVLSYFVLARFRQESAEQLAERVRRRAENRQRGPGAVQGADENAEDAQDSGSSGPTADPDGRQPTSGLPSPGRGAEVRPRRQDEEYR
ncbi:DUF4229 domain-containing protein [Pedococcus sp. 5OH_020]|uniref:DUF4229 domain-containing protein n=1 Tax=Pedococcus sp. 5OH_020 TaxID=2989814 RepID=UPI0022E9F8DE|nr:DUF4229 domain-containing protein [Pedococcus sp. 5OH_020]